MFNRLSALALIVISAVGCSKQQPNPVNVTAAEVVQTSAPKVWVDPAVKAVVARDERPTPAKARPLVIPSGTPIAIRTTTTISTKTARAGQRFAGTLAEPLVVNGQTLARRGARVNGLVVGANRGGRIKGRAQISVRLTALQLTTRGMVPVKTSVITYSAKGTKKRDGIKVGIVSGVGAAIGAIAGGGKGAAIGAGAGAGAGTGYVLSTRGAAAVIPSESVMRFQLRAPVQAGRG
jgi:hypothetical protein